MKITDKDRIDWMEGRSVRVAYRENSIPHLLMHEPGQGLRCKIDMSIRDSEWPKRTPKDRRRK